MAVKTCEGSLEPLVHAEPVEIATPAMSAAIINACRFTAAMS